MSCKVQMGPLSIKLVAINKFKGRFKSPSMVFVSIRFETSLIYQYKIVYPFTSFLKNGFFIAAPSA